MLITQYAHRLPTNYDIGLIRARAKERAPLWDDVPDMVFKAFLLRERGRDGATANQYSSLYLWRSDDGFRRFLVEGRFDDVVGSFGRPDILTRTALDAHRGRGRVARFVLKEEADIPVDADLHAIYAAEIARNREAAARAGTVAAAVGLDTQNWRITRVQVSEDAPVTETGVRYEVLYLAQPLLESLPRE